MRQVAASSVDRFACVKYAQLSGATRWALQTERWAESPSVTTLSFLPTQRLDHCLLFRAAGQADRDRERNFHGGAEAECLVLCSDELGKRPRLYICLGIIACTSENEAFKGDSENNHFYSQREGDISSFFQGQVLALLRSAPVIVAAGACVLSGSAHLAHYPIGGGERDPGWGPQHSQLLQKRLLGLGVSAWKEDHRKHVAKSRSLFHSSLINS